MSKIAVFPGSFDPITLGHSSIIERALPLFDEVIVAIGDNSSKKHMFSLEQRAEWVKGAFEGEEKVSVAMYEGLTVEFCKEMKANFILRGLRNSIDFEYEKSIAQMNNSIAPQIETYFLMTAPELAAINATIVRDIIRNGGDASAFLPDNVRL